MAIKQYTLYVSNDCAQCGDVHDYIERKSIECLVVNVDDEGDSPPVKVKMYPVLFLDQRIMAYGLDIIEHFQRNENRP